MSDHDAVSIPLLPKVQMLIHDNENSPKAPDDNIIEVAERVRSAAASLPEAVRNLMAGLEMPDMHEIARDIGQGDKTHKALSAAQRGTLIDDFARSGDGLDLGRLVVCLRGVPDAQADVMRLGQLLFLERDVSTKRDFLRFMGAALQMSTEKPQVEQLVSIGAQISLEKLEPKPAPSASLSQIVEALPGGELAHDACAKGLGSNKAPTTIHRLLGHVCDTSRVRSLMVSLSMKNMDQLAGLLHPGKESLEGAPTAVERRMLVKAVGGDASGLDLGRLVFSFRRVPGSDANLTALTLALLKRDADTLNEFLRFMKAMFDLTGYPTAREQQVVNLVTEKLKEPQAPSRK